MQHVKVRGQTLMWKQQTNRQTDRHDRLQQLPANAKNKYTYGVTRIFCRVQNEPFLARINMKPRQQIGLPAVHKEDIQSFNFRSIPTRHKEIKRVGRRCYEDASDLSARGLWRTTRHMDKRAALHSRPPADQSGKRVSS